MVPRDGVNCLIHTTSRPMLVKPVANNRNSGRRLGETGGRGTSGATCWEEVVLCPARTRVESTNAETASEVFNAAPKMRVPRKPERAIRSYWMMQRRYA